MMNRFILFIFALLFFIPSLQGSVMRRDTAKLKVSPPCLHSGDLIIMADSIPGIVADMLDDMYNKWYVERSTPLTITNSTNDTDILDLRNSSIADSIYLHRLDALNSPIKLSYNEIVKKYIEMYTVTRKNQMGAMLGLSEYYFPLFEEVLDREGLPDELKYVPVIESALNPRAFSRMGACGLWQFMHGTGKLYKLEINSYIDERRDPIKSTEAAVAFMKDLYNIYEDWILVIAAYNCGSGNVNKAIRRAGGKKNYWDIYYHLPKETRGYVPLFISAMYAFNYYKDHGISPTMHELPSLCDTITISDALHFNQITDVIDISIEELRDLNPQYRGDIIPAGFGKSYPLRLPYNHVAAFIDKQDRIFAYERSKYFNDNDRVVDPKARFKQFAHVAPSNRAKLIYQVKSGDVIGKIAGDFNVKLADLKYWNNKTGNIIRPGEQIVVYVPHDKVAYYQSKIDTKYAGKAPNSEALVEPLLDGEYTLYTIEQGENLWSIAKKFPGVSNNDIMRWNGISNNDVKRLKPGQKLKIKI